MLRKKNTTEKEETHTVLFTGQGTLYIEVNGTYKPLGNVDTPGTFTVRLESTPKSKDRFNIVVNEDNEELLRQPIGNGLTLGYSNSSSSVHWPVMIDGMVQTMAFRFVDHNSKVTADVLMRSFVEMYNRCTYALMTSSELDLSVPDNQFDDYIGNIAASRLPEDDYKMPMYTLDMSHEKTKKTGLGAVCYSESVKYNRALVVREKGKGKEVELQAHAFNLEGFESEAPEVLRLRGLRTCDAALLDDTEKKLLMLSVDDSYLREVDLEQGKVVQEYALPQNVQSVTYSAHVADPSPVYTCLTNNAAFNMDLRMDPRNNIVMEPGYNMMDYALGSSRKPFTCHATSAAGHLVIGDAMGNIRLYTGPPGSRRLDGKYNPKTAKTLLDTKVPIVAVDVTSDGQYVVAVCSKYLLLMRTVYSDDSGNEVNGFQSRMGKNKPHPLKLQPSPAQLSAIGGIDKLDYSSGGFDRYVSGHEVCITACSGNFVFTWSLNAAKRAEETGRSCLGESALVNHGVLGVSATVPNKVMYLTDCDIRMAPLKLHERLEKGIRYHISR